MTLVDASSWIEFLRGRSSEPSLRVKSLLMEGRAAWCELTRVELWNGARGPAEKEALAALEEELEPYPINEQVWAKACALARACRAKGVTVPSTDLIVAACATHHGLPLEHCDNHFGLIPSG